MSLKLVLNKPSTFFVQLTNKSFEDPLHIAKERIMQSLAQYTPQVPTVFDLVSEYEKALKAFNEDGGFRLLSKRTLRVIPWLLFEVPENNLIPLAYVPGFLSSYLKHIRDIQYEKCWCVLYYILMLKYPIAHESFRYFLETIRAAIRVSTDEKVRNIHSKTQAYSLLENDGPETFIRLLPSSHSFNQHLKNAGLTGELQTGQFSYYAYNEWLALLQEKIQTSNNPLSLIEQALIDSVTTDNQFIFPSCKNAFLDALLIPFSSRAASEPIKQLLKSFVFYHFKDPRMDTSRWVNVSVKAKDVFLSWLVESTLQSFFKLLDFVSRSDSTADNQWKYRKAFWSAYLRKGFIDEAWLVLGPGAYENAHHFLSKDSQYGRFISGSGITAIHSSLIMRIGNLIITEWSHNGRYRLWQSFDSNAPKLYKPTYVRVNLVTGAMIEESHAGSENGNWQNKLSNHIEYHSGINMSAHEYMRIEK